MVLRSEFIAKRVLENRFTRSFLRAVPGLEDYAQLGKTWGSAQSPDCGGFSLAQLESLDFSRMDLSEFYAEIAPTLPDAGAMRARVQQKVDSYYK